MNKPKEIFVKLDKCMGCHTCEIVCAVEHSKSKNLFGAIAEKPLPKRRIYVEWLAPDKKIPVLCRHCEEAGCLNACISGAISRSEDGTIITNGNRCIGCWTCVMVCPYGVIGRHPEEKKAYRCDRCPDREVPSCVDSCPVQALEYRTVEAFSAEARKTAATGMLTEEKG